MTNSLIDALMVNMRQIPTQTAFTHLDGDCQEKQKISFGELDKIARKVAVCLATKGQRRQPVMLLFDNPVHFACAFFGCVYAGVTVVPAPVPQFGKSWSRLDAIVKDAGIKLILTDSQVLQAIKGKGPFTQCAASRCRWLTLDQCDLVNEAHWCRPDHNIQQPVFLQYTSGSTGDPKGVMISEQNIIANVQAIAEYFEISQDTVQVSWLPLFHDMGLVGHVILPMLVGCHSVIMKPLAFIKRPVLWLRAISAYSGTLSGAPNFAYELCLSRIKTAECADLNLASWRSAYVGAEPVRTKTLKEFYQRFQSQGFRERSLLPLYGLSESTLMVSGVDPRKGISRRKPEKNGLGSGAGLHVRNSLISCGSPIGDQQIMIVDPDTCQSVCDGGVGEVWLTGSNIAMGYWQKEQSTEKYFKARLAGDTAKHYFRTGDLGFVHNGELFITGRLKDILIIKGENFAAMDLELSAEQSHVNILSGGSAAFSVFVDGEEKAVLVCEVGLGLSQENKEEIVTAVCSTFSAEFGFIPFDIVFVKPHSLPRTTSGKIQRQASRGKYLDGSWQAQNDPILSLCLAKQRRHKQISGEING